MWYLFSLSCCCEPNFPLHLYTFLRVLQLPECTRNSISLPLPPPPTIKTNCEKLSRVFSCSVPQRSVTCECHRALSLRLPPSSMSYIARLIASMQSELISSLVAIITFSFSLVCQRLRWSRGSVLAFDTQVRGFEPGRSRRIFKGK